MIREKAALKLSRQILSGGLIRLDINDKMVEMVARMIMTAVDMDEQRQRSEKILGDVER